MSDLKIYDRVKVSHVRNIQDWYSGYYLGLITYLTHKFAMYDENTNKIKTFSLDDDNPTEYRNGKITGLIYDYEVSKSLQRTLKPEEYTLIYSAIQTWNRNILNLAKFNLNHLKGLQPENEEQHDDGGGRATKRRRRRKNQTARRRRRVSRNSSSHKTPNIPTRRALL